MGRDHRHRARDDRPDQGDQARAWAAAAGLREALSGESAVSRWPVFYGFSPAVVPRPADWPDGYQVTGYWWPQRPAAWSPPAQLEEFLNSGPPPVFFGFGDLNPEDPRDLVELATAAGSQAGVRQVIQPGQTDSTLAERVSLRDS